MLENVPSDMCAQRKPASACGQSDQSICCPHEQTLHPWLSRMRILIRQRECVG